MNSRSAGILSQIQQQRAGRKKPKVVVALKKISLDANQRSAVSTVQANTQSHPVTKKSVGRNSAALSVSMVLHLIIAFLISIYYITSRIDSQTEKFDVDLVREDLKPKRRLQGRKQLKFEAKKQETQALQPNKPVTTAAALPTTSDGFTIPDDAGTTLDVPTPSTNDGLKAIDVKRNLSKPTRAVELDTKAPVLETERSQKSLIDRIEPIAPKDALDELKGVDIQVEAGVVNPKYKYKVKPDYPKNAKQAAKEGIVILQATIDVNGIPQEIVALTNLGFGLEAAAIEALKKTTFRPATKAGNPISLQVEIPFEFKLED